MLQAYLLYFDMNTLKIQAEVLKIENSLPEDLDSQINQVLNSTGYEFYDYNDEITILVDDQGFFKSGNPVFEIASEYGDHSKLAGRLLFVRNIENENSVEIGSIKYEDIFNLRTNLKIQLVGMTKGE